MKAVVIDQIGAPATVREVPLPEPQPGEVLIKVQAAGVNPYDERVRMGALAQMPHQFPLTLGFDLAGTVERLGVGSSRFQLGEPVFGEVFKPVLHDGSYAEYATVPEAGPLARQPARSARSRPPRCRWPDRPPSPWWRRSVRGLARSC